MHTKLPVEASGGHETPLQQRVETRPQLVRAIGRWSLTAGIINAVIGGGIFAYGGFESGIVAASETRNPKGDTVFALISAMTIVTLVYGFIQLTVVGVLPNAAGTTTPIAFALRVILWKRRFCDREPCRHCFGLWVAHRICTAHASHSFLRSQGLHFVPGFSSLGRSLKCGYSSRSWLLAR